jgi:hypothetical protein
VQLDMGISPRERLEAALQVGKIAEREMGDEQDLVGPGQ